MSSRDPTRGGQSRGRTATRRERRLQQQNQSRQAIAEQRQQLADEVGIDADPQQDTTVDRSGDGVTIRLTDSAAKRRAAKRVSESTGVDVAPSEVQLQDGDPQLTSSAENRVAEQQLSELRGDLPAEQDVFFPVDSVPAQNVILRLGSAFQSADQDVTQELAAAGVGFSTSSPVEAIESLNPSAADGVAGLEREQIREAKQDLQERREEFDQESTADFFEDIQNQNDIFGIVAGELSSSQRRGVLRRGEVRDYLESNEAEIEEDIAAEQGLPADAIDAEIDDSRVGIEASVTEKFITEQRNEQQQQLRQRAAKQAGVSTSAIDIEQDGDQLQATVDVGEEQLQARVDQDGGQLQSAAVEDSGRSPESADIVDLSGPAPMGKFSGVTVADTLGERASTSGDINQGLISNTTDSGGFLSENRSADDGLLPSVVIPGVNVSTSEEFTRGVADFGTNITNATESANIEPATPAGAIANEAFDTNIAEQATAGAGGFLGGLLAAPQAVESSAEFVQNAPVSTESVQTAGGVAVSSTASAAEQGLTEPIQFGTGVGLGVVTGTAAVRGARFAGGRSLSGAQRVTPDRSTGQIFDDVATRTRQFRGESRGQLDLTGRQERQTVDFDDTDAGRPVPDDINEQRLISSEDPRRTAGEVGRQRAIERDIEADTPDLEDRGQPSGQSAEVRSVDRPDSVSTQDIDGVEANADRVLNPDTSDGPDTSGFTATERLEARNVGLRLADEDFPRGVDTVTEPTTSAATVTDDVAAAATVTDTGEAASSAPQPEGPRVEEPVSAEVTDQSGGGPSMLTGETGTPAPSATLFENLYRQSGSLTTATTTVGLDGAMSLDTSGFAASTSTTGTASRLATNPFAAAQSGSGLGVDVGAGVDSGARGGLDLGVGPVNRVGVGSGGRSQVDTERTTQTAAGTTTMVGAGDRTRTATNTRQTTTNTRSFIPTGFGSGFGGFGGIPGVPGGSSRRIDDPAPRGGPGEGGGASPDSVGVGDGDESGGPQPGWFAEFLGDRAFGGLTQAGVDQDAAAAASIGLGLPTERVAEAEGQEQQQLEQVAEQFGLDLFDDDSDDDDDSTGLI